MPIVNERWPRDLCPEACRYGRSRNDHLQESPRTRNTSVIRQGRPLWTATVSWSLPNGDRLAELRYWLESLDGFAGSVQVWDFNCPYPYGLNLAYGASSRTFWSYNGAQAPWSYAGFPSHWSLDSEISVASFVGAGATAVPVTGGDPSKLLCLKGQYVQVGRRLYLAAETTQTDGSGDGTIQLVPTQPLLADADAGDPVRLAEAACEMHLIDQNWDESGRAGEGLISVSAQFRETVQDFT